MVGRVTPCAPFGRNYIRFQARPAQIAPNLKSQISNLKSQRAVPTSSWNWCAEFGSPITATKVSTKERLDLFSFSQTLVAADVRRLKSRSSGTPDSEEEVRASSRRLLRVKETITLLRGDLGSPEQSRRSHESPFSAKLHSLFSPFPPVQINCFFNVHAPSASIRRTSSVVTFGESAGSWNTTRPLLSC
jgi:hypothetical protein